jgi:solute carrier family 35 protein F1/2
MSHHDGQQRDADQANDINEIETPVERITVKTKGTTTTPEPSTPSSSINGRLHGTPEFIDDGQVVHQTGERAGAKKNKRFAYLRTRDFWIVLLLTQIIALAQTGTNTLTSLITARGTSIPAFQTFFNYVLLNVVYTSYTIYKYGFAFLDVEGNYFIVLAYKYTNLLSAQLFSFWTVIVVVVISLVVLKVRYHLAQYGGIVLACGGFALLIASDYITKSNNYVSNRYVNYLHIIEKLTVFL